MKYIILILTFSITIFFGCKKKENANKSYLKRPKFILKQKEMFHYGDKLHDLIEKEKKEYIQKKNLTKTETTKDQNFTKNPEKTVQQNISEYIFIKLQRKFL